MGIFTKLTTAEREQRAAEVARAKQRAIRARQFLEDEEFKAAIESLRMAYYQQWRVETDSARRDHLWRHAVALDEIQVTLQGVIESGDAAGVLLEQLDKME